MGNNQIYLDQIVWSYRCWNCKLCDFDVVVEFKLCLLHTHAYIYIYVCVCGNSPEENA